MAVLSDATAAAMRKRLAEEAGAAMPGCGGSPTNGRGLEEPEKAMSSAAHIRVSVRVRPVPPGDDSIIEVAGLGAIAVRKEAGTGGNEFLKSQRGRTEERMFDRVFGPDASQAEVYEWTCRPLIASAVEEGRSATVFVYGATSAGKTHTMFGEREGEHRGMIYRAVQEVFDVLDARTRSGRDSRPLEAKLSFMDIYNENVRDLLQEGNAQCKVMEDERRGVVKVANLREVPVRSADEVLRQLRIGLQARKVEATAANARSSRSHAVFQLTLERVHAALPGPGNPIFQRRGPEQRRVHSCISLIDLAGSERATQTQNRGQALKDGAKINQSLLALANCIDALVCRPPGREGCQTPKRKPPYRDSKLTLLLKGSLLSDCLVSMIANVHPGRDHFEDSNNTLEYAKRASVVKAPIVVRRPRAVSLPASRPPSESPPQSPSPRDRFGSGHRVASPPQEPPDGIDPGPPDSARARALIPAARGADVGVPKRRRTLEGRPPHAASRVASSDNEASRPRLQDHSSEEQLLPAAERSRAMSAAGRLGRSMLSDPPEKPLQRHSSCCVRSSRRLSHCSERSSSSSRGETSAFQSPHGSDSMSPRGVDEGAASETSSTERELPSQVSRDAGRPASPLAISLAVADAPERGTHAAGGAPDAVDCCAGRAAPRPARHAASPRLARHNNPALQSPPPSRRAAATPSCGGVDPLSALRTSPGGIVEPPDVTTYLRIIDTLQADKLNLESRLTRVINERDKVESENALLRAANLQKDQQIGVLVDKLHGRSSRLGESPWAPVGSPLMAEEESLTFA